MQYNLTDKNRNLLEVSLSAINVAVFKLVSIGETLEFEIINSHESWIIDFLSPDKFVSFKLGELFPYLDAFFPDTESVWGKETMLQGELLHSGIWTEKDKNNIDHQLEAMAFAENGEKILLIQDQSKTFSEKQKLYQKAREVTLANEKLMMQLNNHQRQLQKNLEKILLDRNEIDGIKENVIHNASAVLICKPDGNVEIMNKALIDIYHFKNNEASNSSLLEKWLNEAEEIYPEIHQVVKSGRYWEGEFESYSDINEKKWIHLVIGPVLDDKNILSRFVCVANDVSDVKRSSESGFTDNVEMDFNTKLPNRRQFWKELTKLIDLSSRQKSNLALIYIDLDNFKRINDSLGYHAGDFLLNAIAARLAANVKNSDFIAHLGGDEFAILLKNYKSVEIFVHVAESILASVNQNVDIESTSLKITASIGIACYPDDGKDATTLMRNADLAMFHAKKLGTGLFQKYSGHMMHDFMQNVRMENDLAKAMEKNELYLVYQPQVCQKNAGCFRLEALLRWNHSEKGLIPPDLFIPVAEQNGLILEIGNWVLDQACRQAQKLRMQGFDVMMAVNVSAKQVAQIGYREEVEKVLLATGLPPKNLELEITETTLMENMDTVINLLRELRAFGISVSLDDFGSGFSSLSYLKKLPVDFLKLDRTFIHELPLNNESRTITASVINLAHELKIKVIAEGVENTDQQDFLNESGCDIMQGYLFYRPLTPEKIPKVFLDKIS